MNGKKMAYLVAGSFIAILAYFGWTLTSRSAYESAAYSVIQSDAMFEVREYPDLLMATTEMRFSTQGNDGSFSRLFSYISGANENNQKVAMTTPVFMDAESEGKQVKWDSSCPHRLSQTAHLCRATSMLNCGVETADGLP